MPAGRIIDNRSNLRNIYGLFIGIDEYQPGIDPLRGCVRDAKNIQAGFDLKPEHNKLLINRSATRKNILGAIQEAITTVTARDLFILSISAHGNILYDDDFSIVTHDTEKNNMLGTVLSTSYVLYALSQITQKNNGKVLVILDACHAGAMTFDIAKYSGFLGQGGMSCLYSSGPKEVSYEKEFDSGSGKAQQGVFTYHLIEALHGKVKEQIEGHDVVTLRDLYDYVYQQVSSSFDQHPVLIGTLPGNTILKLTLSKAPKGTR